jgi:hypothetical protein
MLMPQPEVGRTTPQPSMVAKKEETSNSLWWLALVPLALCPHHQG